MKSKMREAYRAWEKEFKGSRLGKKALRILREKMEGFDTEVYPQLEREVLAACFHADYYSKHGDKYSRAKEASREINKNVEKLTYYTNALINALSENHSLSADIYLDGQDYVNDPNENEKARHAFFYSEFFDGLHALKKGLEIHKDYNPEGVFTHGKEYTIGNMAFYPSIEKNDRVDKKFAHHQISPVTHLAFELDIFFRLWTHPKGQELFHTNAETLKIPKIGIDKMKGGRPNYNVITPLVQATFPDEEIGSDTLRERIKKYPTAFLVEWKFFEIPIFDKLLG